jgi:hypothetical protein
MYWYRSQIKWDYTKMGSRESDASDSSVVACAFVVAAFIYWAVA